MRFGFKFKSFDLFKKFFYPIHWCAGRSSNGRISGGCKTSRRISFNFCYLDLIRNFGNGIVIGLFCLPNKNYYSAVIYSFKVGFFLIVAPQHFESELRIESLSSNYSVGNSMYLEHVPIGFKLYNLFSVFMRRAVYTRSAGSGSLVVSQEDQFSLLKLPSGLLKKFFIGSVGTFGTVSFNFNFQKFRRAGVFKKYGKKPKVRGVAKNPVDHPHGGGEGKKSKPVAPKSPWGWLTVGYSSVRVMKKRKFKKLVLFFR